MSGDREALFAHLAVGATTSCRVWSVVRKDGASYGFTDHDLDLTFDGMVFKASSGMTARALQQSTGLSVDNSEAVGALSDAAITEVDLMAGRFDGAEVRSWLVNWADVSQRVQQFRGSFGEIQRSAGSFRAELRGLTEALNQPQGRVYQKTCPAVLGDRQCRFDLSQPGFTTEATVLSRGDDGGYGFAGMPEFVNRWFERGRMTVLTGAAAGLIGLVKFDRNAGDQRVVELWLDFVNAPQPGDIVRLEAGCDKLAATCKAKFGNFLNFRGFPDLPGEDWLASYPVSSVINDGRSLTR
ncbi:MAG: DUF2163 domain-containing protein [Paracoccaceae bacterium]